MTQTPSEVELLPLYGTDSADIIYQTNANDGYYGLGGNDVFMASAEDLSSGAQEISNPDTYGEHFYGGSGSDTISYTPSSRAISAHMGLGLVYRMQNGQPVSVANLYSIENLTGSNFSDGITGNGLANILRGGGGNDDISGEGGNDTLYGDSGNDTLDGGDGNDTIDGGTGNDVINGDSGNDTLLGGDGLDNIHGGSGNDTIKGGGHADTLVGDLGDDRIEGGSGNDVLAGGVGTDTVVFGANSLTIVNLVAGTASGSEGNDVVLEFENVETGNGNDSVIGTASANKITTGSGIDSVWAGSGNDEIHAGADGDFVFGESGNDLIYGGGGNDDLRGGNHMDTLHGEDGNDKLNGEGGNDAVYGGNGNDVISGEDGDDELHGHAGNDMVFGGSDDDEISGGSGADQLRGGDGEDWLDVGTGADTVTWMAGDTGLDTVWGFNLAEDRLHFGEGFFAESLAAPGVELADMLMVFEDGADAMVAANLDGLGWTFIAEFKNVDAYQLGQLITSGNILAANSAFDGGPGDVIPLG